MRNAPGRRRHRRTAQRRSRVAGRSQSAESALPRVTERVLRHRLDRRDKAPGRPRRAIAGACAAVGSGQFHHHARPAGAEAALKAALAPVGAGRIASLGPGEIKLAEIDDKARRRVGNRPIGTRPRQVSAGPADAVCHGPLPPVCSDDTARSTRAAPVRVWGMGGQRHRQRQQQREKPSHRAAMRRQTGPALGNVGGGAGIAEGVRARRGSKSSPGVTATPPFQGFQRKTSGCHRSVRETSA